jgi:ATP-dependent exoDNAse (exonuclease V) alpha subunit
LLTSDEEIQAATRRMLELEQESVKRAAERILRRQRTLDQLIDRGADLRSATVVRLPQEAERSAPLGSVPSGPDAA